nr:reverse transcriptase domain-containing protein [Tanacetum cinerariifolium]
MKLALIEITILVEIRLVEITTSVLIEIVPPIEIVLMILMGRKTERACPHHGFSELHQLDTFYNSLNVNDQDSLNSAAGGNFLDKMPQECLKIIKSKSKVHRSRAKAVVAKVSTSSPTPAILFEVSELKDMVRALLLDKKNQSSALAPSSTPAPVKAIQPNCVTCGGGSGSGYRLFPLVLRLVAGRGWDKTCIAIWAGKSGWGRGVKEKDLNRNKMNSTLGTCLSTKLDDTHVVVAYATKETTTPPVVDMTVEKEKLNSLGDTFVLGSFLPLSMPVTTSTGNASGKSSYANGTNKPSGKKLNIHTLFTSGGNGINVVVPVESMRAISEQFANTSYGFFLGKLVAYLVIANYIRNTWGFKPQKEYRHVLKNSTASSSSNKKNGVYLLFRKFEELLTSRKATLVDEAGNPLKKVEFSDDYDSEMRDSYANHDYDEDPYDDDMYEGQDLSQELQAICESGYSSSRSQEEINLCYFCLVILCTFLLGSSFVHVTGRDVGLTLIH